MIDELTADARLRALAHLVDENQKMRYFRECLSIRDKQGVLKPLILNQAQRHLHACAEKMRVEVGYVRLICLKGRQQGFSTYVAGRFYRKTSTRPGVRTRVVSHKDDSTADLFNMVKRFHDNNPIAPGTGSANEKELVFPALDSGYKVETAGGKEIGRGGTAQLFHGSEVAFWANLSKQLAGIGNVVADMPGTEIFLESTANGVGNGFHQLWQSAAAGEVVYRPVFVPWYWQPEYRAALNERIMDSLTPEDREYQRAYGLDDMQMAWRANKINTYESGFEYLFDQEYPAEPVLAFQVPAAGTPMIPVLLVRQMVNSSFAERTGPLIIGCDPAEEGKDRTAIAFRAGRTCFRVEKHERKNTMEVARILADIYEQYQPDALVIDKNGLGVGIYDRLRELNIPVLGVRGSETAEDPERYANCRAEMWHLMRKWAEDRPNRIPNNPELISDLSAPSHKQDSNGRILLEKKDDMRRRGLKSPDFGDALALTFAVNVARRVKKPNGNASSGRRAAGRAGY